MLWRKPMVWLGLLAGALGAEEKLPPLLGNDIFNSPVPRVSVERYTTLFSPLCTELAALSPDGRLVAYTLREGGEVSVVVVPVDAPDHATARVRVANQDSAEFVARGFARPPTPSGRALWLGWISPTRIAVLTNQSFPSYSPGLRTGAFFAFNHDGSDARLVYGGKSFEKLQHVWGLNPDQSAEVIMLSDSQFDEAPLAINLTTGKSRAVNTKEMKALQARRKELEHARRSFELQVRAHLTSILPAYQIEFCESLTSRTRALVRAQSVADPGGFLIFEPASARLWDFMRRGNQTSTLNRFRSEQYIFTRQDGRVFSGFITLPTDPRIRQAPLVLLMPEKLGPNVPRTYRPEVLAFAAMGFSVAVVDGRAASNPSPFPNKVDEQMEYLHQCEALDVLAEHYPVSRKAVALYGQFAGARRGLRLISHQPGRFRCFVAMQPELYEDETSRYKDAFRKASGPPVQAALLLASGQRQNNPAQDLYFKYVRGGPRPFSPRERLDPVVLDTASALRAGRADVSIHQLPRPMTSETVTARATAFAAIEQFLNAWLYNYSVDLGEIQVVSTDQTATPLHR